MFSLPKPLGATVIGGHRQPQFVAGHKAQVQRGGGIVAGIHPAQRVAHDALAQVPVAVAPAHALVYRCLKIAVDVYLLAYFRKDHGHAGVLADGQGTGVCHFQILFQKAQGVLCQRPGLGGPGGGKGRRHIRRQMGVGLDAQGGHRFGDGCSFDLSHSRATPLSRAVAATASATAPATRSSKAPGMM